MIVQIKNYDYGCKYEFQRAEMQDHDTKFTILHTHMNMIMMAANVLKAMLHVTYMQ